MKPIIFITGNLNKVKYTSKFTSYNFEHKKLDLDEIQSLDILKIIEHKVKQAYSIVKTPVLVEDTSVVFHALGNLPGPFIKFFYEELGNEGICKILNPFNNRSATVTLYYGFYDGQAMHVFKGIEKGKISKQPKGSNGFGWDPIFIPKGQTKTHGEMTDEEIEKVSPRKKALIKLEKFLNSIGS